MPDTRFSWAALREHLRKYLWIYIVGIAVCLLGTNLLWTTTRPQPGNDQTVIIYLMDAYGNPEALSDVAEDMFARTKPHDDALQVVQFQNLMYTEEEYMSSMLLVTRLAVGEGDAFMTQQAGLDALVNSQVLEPLDDYVAAGWPGDYGLEPYYATYTDDETGESQTYLAALRLDNVTALSERMAFANEGAYLCVTANGGNVQTTMRALEYMFEDLMEGAHAETGASQPEA
ncbi:MAG: hypothetical protein IKN05_01235 [Clostridia bacterium]|nr:hypothetical protein [Clostridia bacterium]